jgi:hypothetical protein
VIWLRRVNQFPSDVLVMLQLPNGEAAVFVKNWAMVQVCPMYSDATQTLPPSTTAAP